MSKIVHVKIQSENKESIQRVMNTLEKEFDVICVSQFKQNDRMAGFHVYQDLYVVDEK